jgi:hypothetical protein
MIRPLIRSDRLVIRSDEYPESFLACLTQTPPPSRARIAADRICRAWHIGRDLQALRSTKLPLRRRARTWTEALFVRQPTWRASSQGLRAQRYSRGSCQIDQQLPQAARSSRRDLRDQYGTLATTRGSWIGRHGPGSRRFRLRQGGRHRRQHGCVLSFRRRPAVRSGGAR